MQDLQFYISIGWEHIISLQALDHQLFIAVLAALYVLRDWKKVLLLVTAFTIGHSLTLVLSVLDIFRFSDAWVEFLIPCTIWITAIANLKQSEITPSAMRGRYGLALIFGLIHGMGFANTIRFMLAKDQSIVTGILGFNIGLELGQIAMVSVFLGIAFMVVEAAKIQRRSWIIFLSSGILALALKMSLERLPF